jgi:hypothetical protein
MFRQPNFDYEERITKLTRDKNNIIINYYYYCCNKFVVVYADGEREFGITVQCNYFYFKAKRLISGMSVTVEIHCLVLIKKLTVAQEVVPLAWFTSC